MKLSFTNRDIEAEIVQLDELYPGKIIANAEKLLYYQRRKYAYIF